VYGISGASTAENVSPPGRRTPARRRVATPGAEAGNGEADVSVSMTMPILIVDDYNTMIRILRNLLRQLGFTNIDEACDGGAALAKMRSKDYALVISDSNMAPMTGIELLQRVRADERMKSTPFVVIADDPAEGALATSRAGASTYLVKPFTAQSLKSKLVPVLGPF
jgi:two-component system chemotaxis response regulator CheY